jgi:hypothetical protein
MLQDLSGQKDAVGRIARISRATALFPPRQAAPADFSHHP